MVKYNALIRKLKLNFETQSGFFGHSLKMQYSLLPTCAVYSKVSCPRVQCTVKLTEIKCVLE